MNRRQTTCNCCLLGSDKWWKLFTLFTLDPTCGHHCQSSTIHVHVPIFFHPIKPNYRFLPVHTSTLYLLYPLRIFLFPWRFRQHLLLPSLFPQEVNRRSHMSLQWFCLLFITIEEANEKPDTTVTYSQNKSHFFIPTFLHYDSKYNIFKITVVNAHRDAKLYLHCVLVAEPLLLFCNKQFQNPNHCLVELSEVWHAISYSLFIPPLIYANLSSLEQITLVDNRVYVWPIRVELIYGCCIFVSFHYMRL